MESVCELGAGHRFSAGAPQPGHSASLSSLSEEGKQQLPGPGSPEVCSADPLAEEPQGAAPAGSFVKSTGTCQSHSRVCGFLLEL